jgi:hypothetical protein
MKIVIYCLSLVLAIFAPVRSNAQDVSNCHAIYIFHNTTPSAEVYSQSNNPLLADHFMITEDDDLNESDSKEVVNSKSATNSALTFGPVIVKTIALKSWSSKPIYALPSSRFIFLSVFRL